MAEEIEKKNIGSSCDTVMTRGDASESETVVRLTEEEEALRTRVRESRAQALKDIEGYRQKENAPGRRPRIPSVKPEEGRGEPIFFDTILLGSDATREKEQRADHTKSSAAVRREMSAEEFFATPLAASDAPIVADGQDRAKNEDTTQPSPQRMTSATAAREKASVSDGDVHMGTSDRKYDNVSGAEITELPPFTPAEQPEKKRTDDAGRAENFAQVTSIKDAKGVNLDLHIIDEKEETCPSPEEDAPESEGQNATDSSDMRINACDGESREFLYVGGAEVGRISVDRHGSTSWYDGKAEHDGGADNDSDVGFTPIRKRRPHDARGVADRADEARLSGSGGRSDIDVMGIYPDPRRTDGDVGTDYRYPDPRRTDGDVGTDYRYPDPRRTDGDVGTDYRYPDPRRTDGDIGTDYRYPDPRRTDGDVGTDYRYPDPRRTDGDVGTDYRYPDPRRTDGDIGTDYRYPDPRRTDGDVGTDYRYPDPRRTDGDVGTDYRYPDPRRTDGDVGTDYRYPDPRRTDGDVGIEPRYPEPYRRPTGDMDVVPRYPDGEVDGRGYEYSDEYSYPEDTTGDEVSELDKLGYYHLSDIAGQTERDEELSRAYDEFIEGKGYTPIGGGIVAHRDYSEQRRTDVAAVKARIEIGIGRLEKECGDAEFSYSRTLENRRERKLRRLAAKRLNSERKRLYKAIRLEKQDNKRYYDFLKLDLASLKLPEDADRQKLLQMRRRLVELLLMRDEYNQRLLEVYTGSKNGGRMRSDGVYAAEYKARKKAYRKHRRLAKVIAVNRVNSDDKRMLFALMDESITLHGRRAAMIYLLTKEKVRGGAKREALAEKKAAERALKKNRKTLERVEAKTVVEARKKHRRRRAMIWGWSALIVLAALGFFIWIFHDAIGNLFLRLGKWLNDTFGWNIF